MGSYDAYALAQMNAAPKREETLPKKTGANDYKLKKERESERRKLNTRITRAEKAETSSAPTGKTPRTPASQANALSAHADKILFASAAARAQLRFNTRITRAEKETEELDGKIAALTKEMSEVSGTDYQRVLEMSEELERLRERLSASLLIR